MITNQKKITIVGAGLAGLTLAYRLKKMGVKNIELYEAKNRVGGRVFTVNTQGILAELGGQNFLDGGDAKNILKLAKELSLQTVKKEIPLAFQHFDGKKFIDPKHHLLKFGFTFENLKKLFSQLEKYCSNMQQIIEELFPNDLLLQESFAIRLAAYEGLEPKKLPLNYLPTLFYMLLGGLSVAHPGNGENNFIEHEYLLEGNAKLCETIANYFPNNLYLKHVLKKITKIDDKYYLEFKSHKKTISVTSDIVILSIPCSVYKNIEFADNVLNPILLKDIKAVDYGTNAKIIVPLSENHPQTSSFTNGRAVAFYPGKYDSVTLYYIGDNSKFTKKTITETFKKELPLLEKGYGLSPSLNATVANDKNYSCYTGPVGHSWPNDPFAKGSYSCFSLNKQSKMSKIEIIGKEEVKSLFKPIDNTLFFAGEHTSTLLDVAGTMEAAVESGEKTARLIENFHKV